MSRRGWSGFAAVLAAAAFAPQRLTAPVAVIVLLACGCAHAPPAIVQGTLAPSGHLLVPVMLGDRGPYPFVVDTGCSRTVVAEDVAVDLGMLKTPKVRGGVAFNGAPLLSLSVLPTVTVGARRYQPPFGPVMDLSAVSQRAGMKLSGILGMDVLGEDVLVADYAHARAALVDSVDQARALGLLPKNAEALPFVWLGPGLIQLHVWVAHRRVPAIFDLGARKTILNRAAAEGLVRVPGADVTLGADNMPVESELYRVDSLRAGGAELGPLNVSVFDGAIFKAVGFEKTPALILGLDALRGRVVGVDSRARLVFIAQP